MAFPNCIKKKERIGEKMDEGNGFVKRLLQSYEAQKIDGLVLEAAFMCVLASQGVFCEDNIPL